MSNAKIKGCLILGKLSLIIAFGVVCYEHGRYPEKLSFLATFLLISAFFILFFLVDKMHTLHAFYEGELSPHSKKYLSSNNISELNESIEVLKATNDRLQQEIKDLKKNQNSLK